MSVYDKRGNQNATDNLPTDDDLRHATGISKHEESEIERAALNDQEASADTIGKGYTGNTKTDENADDIEQAERNSDDPPPDDTVGSGYSGDGTPRKRGGWLTKKRAAVTSGVLAAVITGILGINGAGLLQFGQLDALFGQDFASQDEGHESRMHGILRAIRTGDIGETRLSYMQSKVAAKALERLAKEGITINRTSVTARFGSVTVDLSVNSRYAALYNSKDANARQRAVQAFMRDNNLTTADIKGGLSEGKPTFDMTNKTIAAQRGAVFSLVEQAGYGKIATSVTARIINVKLNNPSALHPFKKLGAYGDSKVDAIAKWKQERSKRIRAETPEKVSRLKSAKEKFAASGAGKFVAGALLPAGAICIAKTIADDTAQISYENVVEPSQRAAMEARGIWAQQQSGDDMESILLQTATDQLENQNKASPEYGTTVWDGEGMMARQGQSGGIPLQQGMKDSFSSDSGAVAVSEFLSNYAGADALCSPPGLVAQFAAGAALLVLTVGTGNAASTAVNIGVSSAAIYGLMEFLPQLLADKPIFEELEEYGYGAMGGSLMDAGNVANANLSYIYNGGVAQSPAQTLQTTQRLKEKNREEFASKSFASRMFDATDYRSLLGKVVNKQKTNPASALASLTRNTLSIGSATTGNLASIFDSRANAYDVTPYDYGFPRYGFSDEDLNNPEVQDPFENAEKAVPFLETYASEAKRCFGVDIAKNGEGKWGVTAATDMVVNPTSADYNSEDCVKKGNLDWLRVRFFIFDTKTMEAYACYESLDDQSCTNNGVVTAATTTATPGQSGTANAVNGIATDAQLADFPEDIRNQCKSGTAQGNIVMLCNGAKYIDQVNYVLVHPYTGKQFSERWAAGERDLTLDCSLFVGVVLWESFKLDKTTTSQNYYDAENFDKVPVSQMQPGDLVVSPGHIAISLIPGKKVLNSSSPNAPPGPENDLYVSGQVSGVHTVLRYKGGMK